MIRFTVVLSFFIFSIFSALGQEKCQVHKVSETDHPRICFFSLNGDKESVVLSQKLQAVKCTKPDEEISSDEPWTCKSTQGKSIQIKEFYAGVKDNQSVSKTFEEMTNTHCDGLVISGHHVGYFTGQKTDQQNRLVNEVDLNLTFLEKLSCLKEKGPSNCKEWFNKIKFLHLHGSHTAGNTEDINKTRTQKIMDDYRGSYWNADTVTDLNREVASTMDDNNPLSSRYLRMFPSAAVFAWKEQAPTINQGSYKNFIGQIEISGQLACGTAGCGGKGFKEGVEGLINFLTGESETDQSQNIYVCDNLKSAWGKLSGSAASFDIAENEKSSQEEARNIGCDLSNAIEDKSEGDIKAALDKILPKSESDKQTDKQTVYFHQNINRLFQALNSDSPLTKDLKKEIIQKLKKSESFKKFLNEQARKEDESIVRRGDYIYLFKKIYTDPNSNNITKALEDNLLDSTIASYEENNSLPYKAMLIQNIWKNRLGDFTVDDPKYNKLMELLENEEDISLKAQKIILKERQATRETKVILEKMLDSEPAIEEQNKEKLNLEIERVKKELEWSGRTLNQEEKMLVSKTIANIFFARMKEDQWDNFSKSIPQ